MNFTGINFTLVPDNSYAYIAFDLEYGFRLLEERRDTNAAYFRDLEDPDLDGISNNPVTDSALIVKSNIIDYSGSLAPLESRVGELIKIGDVWATVLSYNSTKSITVDNHPIRLPAIQSIENNSINIPSHGLNNGEAIKFYAISPPMGIVPGTTYYVRDTSTDSFKIAASAGGAALSISGAIIGEFYASKIYSIFTPTLNYDVIKDTIIGKVFRTGAFYTVETFYNVSGESITSFELVDALPASGDYEGQVVLYDNTLYTWNGVSWVTSSGESARTVSLSVTQQAFDYTSNGNKVGTPTSTVTATAFGTTGTLTYVFKVDGTVVTGSGNTYLYTPNSSFDEMPDIVTVDLYEDGLLVASDLITMFGVIEGGDAITVILSNEAHTIPTDSAGNNGVFTGSGTTIKVFRGNTPLNYVSGGTTSSFDVSVINGPTVSGSTSVTGTGTATATIGDLTGISASTGLRDITVTVYFDGATTTFSKVQSFSKSLAGAAGANSVIYYVDTSASAIKRNLDGTLTPSTVTFSAFSITGNNSPVAYAGRFIVRRNGTAVYTSDDDEATYVYTPTTPASLTDVKVELYLAGGTTTLLDQETLPVVQDGSSAITVSVDNDNLSFAGPVTGYVGIAFGSATSTTRVYRGSTLLDYAASGANTWNVTAQSSTGVTVATPTGSGTTYVVPVPTAMSADSAFTDLTIAVRDQAGVASTFNARITYSLSRAGAAGGTGPTGPTGTQALIAYGIGNSNYAFSGSTVVIGAATSPPANASIVYNFASNVEGFTTAGSGSSLSQSNGALIWTAASDSRILSPTLDLPGASISKIRIRLRATSANPTWEGIIYYTTPGHGESGLYYGVIPPPVIPIVQSTYYIVDVDMSNLGPNGGTDWIDSTINSIRFDISDSSSTWEIDWIALGSNFAGTMPASGDWGLTTSWTPTPQTLTTNGTSLYQVTGLFNPTTDQTIWTGYPYLSSLKVGQLSAIAANIGEVTAGLVRNSTNTMRVDLDNGRIVFDNGVVMKITGNGFGSTNQFLEWTGPSQAINLCTEANGFLWIKTNGDAYFGGSLSIGTLTTKAATSSLANDAETETATFGSNGGTIVIAHSFNRGYNSASYSPTNISNSSGTATFGLSLSRSLAGGAYSVVDTLTVNCPWSVTNQGFEPELGYLITRSLGGSGSKSYTDPTNSTQTRQYKLAITSLTGVSGSGALVNSQLLSIIASEE